MKHPGNYLKSYASLYVMAFFYFAAGINHFINPEFYLPLIPDYFPFPDFINIMSGLVELVLSFLLLLQVSRKTAAYLIIALLIVFIPSHIYFIQMGSCVEDGLCVPDWVGIVRLIVIHPALIYWSYKISTLKKSSA